MKIMGEDWRLGIFGVGWHQNSGNRNAADHHGKPKKTIGLSRILYNKWRVGSWTSWSGASGKWVEVVDGRPNFINHHMNFDVLPTTDLNIKECLKLLNIVLPGNCLLWTLRLEGSHLSLQHLDKDALTHWNSMIITLTTHINITCRQRIWA